MYVPERARDDARLFVAALARHHDEQLNFLADLCDVRGSILVAPRFATDGRRTYQRLGRVGRGSRSDAVLNAMIEEVGDLTGADCSRIYLFGFSGSAQFAHRYAMAHPQRVAAAVVAGAGWYTHPDPRIRYPYGIRPSRDFPDMVFDPEAFLRVRIAVLVGENDHTGDNLKRSRRVDERQGLTRIDRARSWVAAMRSAAEAYGLEPLVTLEELKDSDHSFETCVRYGGLGEKVHQSLFERPPPPWTSTQ